MARILIIGNAGAGKSTLAVELAEHLACPRISLDDVYWIDQIALHKRGAADALDLLASITAAPSWVVEGVFGWLIEPALPRATTLIWLDLPWAECQAGLLARGPMGISAAEFAGLLAWAELYWIRQSSSSHAAHAKIFERFAGSKWRLTARTDMVAFRSGHGLK